MDQQGHWCGGEVTDPTLEVLGTLSLWLPSATVGWCWLSPAVVRGPRPWGRPGSSSPSAVTLQGGGWGRVVATSVGTWASGGCMAQIGSGDAGGRVAHSRAPLAPNISRQEQLLALIT